VVRTCGAGGGGDAGGLPRRAAGSHHPDHPDGSSSCSLCVRHGECDVVGIILGVSCDALGEVWRHLHCHIAYRMYVNVAMVSWPVCRGAPINSSKAVSHACGSCIPATADDRLCTATVVVPITSMRQGQHSPGGCRRASSSTVAMEASSPYSCTAATANTTCGCGSALQPVCVVPLNSCWQECHVTSQRSGSARLL
jgi:hypothetical protein